MAMLPIRVVVVEKTIHQHAQRLAAKVPSGRMTSILVRTAIKWATHSAQ
jgi:hypothetical protein